MQGNIAERFDQTIPYSQAAEDADAVSDARHGQDQWLKGNRNFAHHHAENLARFAENEAARREGRRICQAIRNQ